MNKPKHGDCRLVQSGADSFAIEMYINTDKHPGEWHGAIASGSRESILALVESNEREHRKRAIHELARAEECRVWAEVLREG